MPDLQGIFIDFYGTLAGGDREAVVAICQQVVDDHGLAVAAEDLAGRWGHSYFEAIESVDGHFRLLREIERDTLIDTLEPLTGRRVPVDGYIERFNLYCSRPPLFDEVHEVLASLVVPYCILSNADERELRAAVTHHGLDTQFIVTSESARAYKPDARIFQTALQLTGWSADRVLHVGDSLHSDVGGAKLAGIRTAWVNRAVRMTDIGTEVPDLIWADLRPLMGLKSI